MPAALRAKLHHLVDVLWRSQFPAASPMPGLSAGLAAALLSPSALPLLPRQTVGGRRLGRRGGVLSTQSQLPLQVRHLLFQFVDPLLLLNQLPGQPLVFPFQFPPVRLLHWLRRSVISPLLCCPQAYRLPGFSPKIQVQIEDFKEFIATVLL